MGGATRRRFLRGATLAAVGAPLLAATRPLGSSEAAASAGPGARSLFTHGVASGDPRADGVVLWTRTDRPGTLTWRVATDPRLGDVVASGSVEADGGSVAVDVAGLAAGTTYWFGFRGGGLDSSVGRTRTLPAPGRADRVRIAVLACGNLESGWFNAYARVAERDDLDLVVHLGDYLYEYDVSADGAEPLPGRAHHPRVRLRTVDEYRARYAQYRADPDLQHLHGRHPVVSIWDDHEVANDSWANGADGHLATDGPFSTRLAAAMTAWREWHPRSPDRPEAWRRLPLGGLLDAFVVDGRSHRPRMGDGSEPGAEDDTLGPAQLAWLRSGLAAPAGRWPVVLTQQPITPRFDRDGRRSARAGWGGFPVAQDAVLSLLAGAGATVVSGDLHGSWLLDRGGAGVEAVVPSASSRTYADRFGPEAAAVEEAELRRTNAALRWVDVRSHGYVVLDATTERLRIEWWFVDTVEDRAAGQRLAHALDLEST